MRTKTSRLLLGIVLLVVFAHISASAFYDPGTQRWLNRDPIQESGGFNLFSFVGNGPIYRIDAFGLVLKIDPNASPEFRERMRDCVENLVNNSPTGRDLVQEAIDSDKTITISPDPDGAGTSGAVTSKDDKTWPQNPTIGMHPDSPNGIAPEDHQEAEKSFPSEAPPNNRDGCAVTLAHELGHALYDYSEPDNVPKIENPVRNDFGLPSRNTYRGIPIK
jgi:hypothetical protein